MKIQRHALLVSSLIAQQAFAGSDDLEALMQESIVSTPSKTAQASAVAPATSSVITAEDLRTYGLRSLDEAINFVAMGMITTQSEHAVEIGARGVVLTTDYGNHVLLLIDGVPANEPWGGSAFFERGAGVPFELIDHIEVTLGPGSVMHGGQAMLGVINVVTKHERDYRGVHLIVEGDTATPVTADGSIETSPLSAYGHGYRLGAGWGKAFTLAHKPTELTLQIELYRHVGPDWDFAVQDYGADAVTGDPRDFGPRTTPGTWGGTATRSDYTDVPAAYLRFRHGDLTATLRVGSYTRASPYSDALISGGGDDFDDRDNRERDRWLGLGIDYRLPISPRFTVNALVYGLLTQYHWFSRRSAAEECPEGLVGGCERTLVGSGISGGADLRLSVDEPELDGGTFLGLDLRARDATSDYDVVDRVTGVQSEFNNDYSRTDALIAPYVQQSWAPAEWLDFNLGARLDHDTRFGTELSPRAAVGISHVRDGRIKAIYSEAFRPPSAYELNYQDPFEQIASPNLGAESVRSLELSIEQRFGAHRLFFGVFHSSWSDMVTYRTLDDEELAREITAANLDPSVSEAYAYGNAGSLENYGYNAAYEGALAGRLHFGMNLTAAYSRLDLGDGSGPQPLSVGPAFFGNGRLSYRLSAPWPTPALACRFLTKRPADRAFDGGFTDAPYAPADFQLHLTLSGAIPALEGIRYRVGGTYATASTGPYVIGPLQYAADETTVAALSPQRRFTAFLGLEYVIE
jgi:outer membrane receptor for ferrienterochelin and colicins